MFNHLILIVLANPTTKQELLASIADGYAKLCDQMAKMSSDEKAAPFAEVSTESITEKAAAIPEHICDTNAGPIEPEPAELDW